MVSRGTSGQLLMDEQQELLKHRTPLLPTGVPNGTVELGNRFLIGRQHTRRECIELYRTWLRAEWKNGGAVKAELLRVARKYRERGDLTLVCWCAPSACHADVIQEAIKALVQKGVER